MTRHQFSRIEFGLRVLGHAFHHIVDNTKNLDDNVFGGHEVLRSSDKVSRHTRFLRT
jgi:hypothetical protein